MAFYIIYPYCNLLSTTQQVVGSLPSKQTAKENELRECLYVGQKLMGTANLDELKTVLSEYLWLAKFALFTQLILLGKLGGARPHGDAWQTNNKFT